MPRGSRRRSGSRSPRRRRGSRAARKSPRRSRSPKRSPRRFRGVEDERAYGKSESDREEAVTQLKMQMNKLNQDSQLQPGYTASFLSSINSKIIPYLKILVFHACVNADELIQPKKPQTRELLFTALREIETDINFPGYGKLVENIGVKNAFNPNAKSLSVHVARAMLENIGEPAMKETAKALIHTLQSVVKEVEVVMGYDIFKKAGLIKEYDDLKKDLETALKDLEAGNKAVKATTTLVFAFQKRKKYHKAMFARLYPPNVLMSLQESFGDKELDKVVPKLLERFPNVPKLKNVMMEPPVAIGTRLDTESVQPPDNDSVQPPGETPVVGTASQVEGEKPIEVDRQPAAAPVLPKVEESATPSEVNNTE